MPMPETTEGHSVFTFGAFRVDIRSGELTKHGLRIKLQEKPFQILVQLLVHAGQVVTRDDLRQSLWDSNTYVEFDHSLNIAMCKLRESLCDSAETPRYIETLPRRGYRFIGEVSANGHATADCEVSAQPVLPRTVRDTLEKERPSFWMWAALAGTLGSVALAAAFTVRHAPPVRSSIFDFHARDWVLIAHFDNRTREAIFNGTVEAALARELVNSQFVKVVPRERVNDALALMRLPTNTVVDASTGREICVRDGGIRALISGRVARLSSQYVLSAQIIDPASAQTVASYEEDAEGQSQVLRAVHALANDVREGLGQTLSETQQSEIELQKVTTPSLNALQLYSQAEQEMRDRDPAAAFELLEQAINDDPKFASAYTLAAWSLQNQFKSAREYMPYAKRALELSGHSSEAERYFIEGSYYQMAGQPEKAIAAYEALLAVDPGHFWGMNNLSGLYQQTNRMPQLMNLTVRRAQAEPNSFRAQYDAGEMLLILAGNADSARPYFERAIKLLSVSRIPHDELSVAEALSVQLYPAYEAWMKDDVATAQAELDRAEQAPVARDSRINALDFGEFRLALGEDRRARAWLQKVPPPNPAITWFTEEAMFSSLCGEQQRARSYLGMRVQFPEPKATSLMVREGMVREASALAHKYQDWPNAWPRFRDIAVGELLLAQGETTSGMRWLSQGVKEDREHTDPTYFLGAESLARAYEKRGNLSAAVAVLESAAANRIRVDGDDGMSGAVLWMRDELELARLYGRLGRAQDAEKIEKELRKLLAYADPDDPLLVELNRLEDKPSIAANRN